MAGSYPDVPGRRMAWDTDGTVGLYQHYTLIPPVEMSAGQKQIANDESDTAAYGTGTDSAYFMVVFPELRDVYGMFASSDAHPNNISQSWYSTDTTNGVDGTWISLVSNVDNFSGAGTVYAYYRNYIHTSAPFPLTSPSVRGLKLYGFGGFSSRELYAWHIYGEIAAGSTPDRLLYINNSTGLEYTLPVDFGDIPRGAVYDEDWYIKSNSSTKTAVNTTISRESLYLNSHLFYQFSTGVGFADTLGPVASITAGSRWPPSNALTVRCDPPSTASLGLHAARIVLDTSSWS